MIWLLEWEISYGVKELWNKDKIWQHELWILPFSSAGPLNTVHINFVELCEISGRGQRKFHGILYENIPIIGSC